MLYSGYPPLNLQMAGSKARCRGARHGERLSINSVSAAADTAKAIWLARKPLYKSMA
jgi:hypothetical protein